MASIPPDPNDWYVVYVHTPDRTLNVGAVVRYRDYDCRVLDDGVLRLVLHDRAAVYLFAPGQWARMEARPAGEDVATQMNEQENP